MSACRRTPRSTGNAGADGAAARATLAGDPDVDHRVVRLRRPERGAVRFYLPLDAAALDIRFTAEIVVVTRRASRPASGCRAEARVAGRRRLPECAGPDVYADLLALGPAGGGARCSTRVERAPTSR